MTESGAQLIVLQLLLLLRLMVSGEILDNLDILAMSECACVFQVAKNR